MLPGRFYLTEEDWSGLIYTLMEFREFIDMSHGGIRKPRIGPKLWKAKEADVMKMWKDARSDIPVLMSPVSIHHRGSKYAQDGIRITGSSTFINSVLGKLKDILAYESPNVDVEVEYRQILDKTGQDKGSPKFVFYVHLKEKGGGKKDDK